MTTPSAALRTARARQRRGAFPILTATLRESQMLIAAACFYIVAIGLLVGLIFPAMTTIDLRSYIGNSAVGSLLGMRSLPESTFATYLAVELYSSFFLLLFGGVLAYAAGASIARNVEDGTIDLALARPVSRTRLYLEKWAALLVGMVAILGVSLLTGWADTLIFSGATLNWRWFLLGHLELVSLLLFVVGVGLLISAGASGGRTAGGAATAVVVVGYLAQTFGTASDRLAFLKYLGPYFYAPAGQVMVEQRWAGTWQFLIPVTVGLLAGVVGLLVFRHRDITA
ncbi:MAG TPA: ABC transporter permease subunit [Candidatus Dormibacteraeota bacterium]|nr:ABC transporter permease subunit [Candidatus Dormibacteraeota bacterium]